MRNERAAYIVCPREEMTFEKYTYFDAFYSVTHSTDGWTDTQTDRQTSAVVSVSLPTLWSTLTCPCVCLQLVSAALD